MKRLCVAIAAVAWAWAPACIAQEQERANSELQALAASLNSDLVEYEEGDSEYDIYSGAALRGLTRNQPQIGLPFAEKALELALADDDLATEGWSNSRTWSSYSRIIEYHLALSNHEKAIAYSDEFIARMEPIMRRGRFGGGKRRVDYDLQYLNYARFDLAKLHEYLGNIPAAEALFKSATKQTRELIGNDSKQYLEAMDETIRHLARLSKDEDAKYLADFLLQVTKNKHGEFSREMERVSALRIVVLQMGPYDSEAVQEALARQDALIEKYGILGNRTLRWISTQLRAFDEFGDYDKISFAKNFNVEAYFHYGRDKGVRDALWLRHNSAVAAALVHAGNAEFAERIYSEILPAAHAVAKNDPGKLTPLYSNYALSLLANGRIPAAQNIVNSLDYQIQISDDANEGFKEHTRKVAKHQNTTLKASIQFEIAMATREYFDAEDQLDILDKQVVFQRPADLEAMRARLYLATKNFEKAELFARKAMQIEAHEADAVSPNLARYRSLLARALIGQGKPRPAIKLLDRLLEGPGSPFHSLNDNEQVAGNMARANAAIAIPERQNPKRGYHPIADANFAAETISWSTSFYGRQSSFAKERQNRVIADYRIARQLELDTYWFAPEPSEKTIARKIRLGNYVSRMDRAFAYMQQSGLSALDVTLAEVADREKARRKSPEARALLDKRDELYAQWRAELDTIVDLAGSFSAEAAEKRQIATENLHALDKERAEIDFTLREQIEGYSKTIPSSIARAETQKVLRDGEAILLLVTTANGTHSYALTKDDARWHFNDDFSASEVTSLVRSIQWDVGALSEDDLKESELGWLDRPLSFFDRSAAYKIYQQAIEPVADVLAGHDKVFIYSVGPISTLPLGLLVTEPSKGLDDDAVALRETAWLGDRFSLVTLPSVAALKLLREFSPETTRSEFLGFGDPELAPLPEEPEAEDKESSILAESTKDRGRDRRSLARFANQGLSIRGGTTLADPAAIKKLPSLPGTRIELDAMAKVYADQKDTLRLQKTATERQFKRAKLTNLDVLAVATHGLLASETAYATQPGLIFTPPDKATEEDDGYLSAEEIAALTIEANWVILSACNTAGGSGDEGAPGLTGLARAFIYAGSRNLLVSHWYVLDEVAPVLTVKAIEIMRERPEIGRAKAFKLAMRNVRMTARNDNKPIPWSHPRAWAPFSLVGEGSR